MLVRSKSSATTIACYSSARRSHRTGSFSRDHCQETRQLYGKWSDCGRRLPRNLNSRRRRKPRRVWVVVSPALCTAGASASHRSMLWVNRLKQISVDRNIFNKAQAQTTIGRTLMQRLEDSIQGSALPPDSRNAFSVSSPSVRLCADAAPIERLLPCESSFFLPFGQMTHETFPRARGIEITFDGSRSFASGTTELLQNLQLPQ